MITRCFSREGGQTEAMRRLHLMLALLIISILSSSCGGGQSSGTNSVGPTAILNGSTLSGATSSWTAANCGVSVELTSDSGFKFIVHDSSGATSSASATWSASGTNGATVNFSTGLGGFVWVQSLTNISGSTASKNFSAGVKVADTTSSQSLGTCSFSLQSNPLP